MFITIKSGLSETTIRLSDIGYCNSSYSYRLQEYDTYLYPVDGLIEGENKLLVREMLVHKESRCFRICQDRKSCTSNGTDRERKRLLRQKGTKVMHKFKVLSDKTFSEIEEKFNQLEERLSKTEEALSKLENNVTDTSNDIEKLELITTKIEQFNRQMSLTNRRIYLELKKNFVYLIVPVPGYEESCIELSVANISEFF